MINLKDDVTFQQFRPAVKGQGVEVVAKLRCVCCRRVPEHWVPGPGEWEAFKRTLRTGLHNTIYGDVRRKLREVIRALHILEGMTIDRYRDSALYALKCKVGELDELTRFTEKTREEIHLGTKSEEKVQKFVPVPPAFQQTRFNNPTPSGCEAECEVGDELQ